jgi:hypothetical protein
MFGSAGHGFTGLETAQYDLVAYFRFPATRAPDEGSRRTPAPRSIAVLKMVKTRTLFLRERQVLPVTTRVQESGCDTENGRTA